MQGLQIGTVRPPQAVQGNPVSQQQVYSAQSHRELLHPHKKIPVQRYQDLDHSGCGVPDPKCARQPHPAQQRGQGKAM